MSTARDQICTYCNKPIKADELRFYSHQAGMQGLYHWACYTARAQEVNERGQCAILSTGATLSILRPSQVDEYDSMSRILYAD